MASPNVELAVSARNVTSRYRGVPPQKIRVTFLRNGMPAHHLGQPRIFPRSS